MDIDGYKLCALGHIGYVMPSAHGPCFSHIRPLGAAGALAVDICICFHDIESYIFAKSFPSLAV